MFFAPGKETIDICNPLPLLQYGDYLLMSGPDHPQGSRFSLRNVFVVAAGVSTIVIYLPPQISHPHPPIHSG